MGIGPTDPDKTGYEGGNEEVSDPSELENFDAILFDENGEINMSVVIYLVAYFVSKTCDLQLETVLVKLEASKAEIEKAYEKILDQIIKAIEARIKNADAAFWTKVAMWAAAAIAVLAALAITIASLGAGAGLLAAVITALPAIIGAILAVGCATVEELGYMDEIIEGFAEIFKAMGCNNQLAMILGAILFSLILIVITAGAGYASYSMLGSVASTAANAGSAAANTARGIGQAIEIALTLMNIIVEIGGAVAGILSGYFMFQALGAGSKENEYRADLMMHEEENRELIDRYEDDASNREVNYDIVGRMQQNHAWSVKTNVNYI